VTAQGLSEVEASRRLAEHGPNEPVRVHRLSGIGQFVHLFANPIIVILLVASLVSASLGQGTDAVIIATMILLGTSIDFWQTYRSQRAADRLRASVAPTATVLRDGEWRDVPIRSVVPGDVFRLSAGDLVPADAQLLESRDLSVQQAMLTGESLPVDKDAASPQPEREDPSNLRSVFLGTSVVSGTGIATAVATGPATMFGAIAARLRSRPPDTEFERGLHRFGLLILRATMALVLFILLTGVALHHDPFETLLFAVALGVGLAPEFLPMISSVTLTAGALRMAREGVIVKHLPGIQNLGSIDVLCTDKTGTLTEGNVTLIGALDPSGVEADRPFALAAVNSRFETGIKSPLDIAILQRAGQTSESGYRKVDEIPFDFERRRLSLVVDSPDGVRLLITKGAPESMLPLVTMVESGGTVVPFDTTARAAAVAVFDRLSAQGQRVLAVTCRELAVRGSYGREDEAALTLAGFLVFADPLRADARAAVTALASDGVVVKLLTGDNDQVTRHVCEALGIDAGRVVTGDELARLDDAALGHVVEHADVFTRLSPAQKNRILIALKRRGHVVGFLGDGINDAPSLHTADVGISVTTATDVAREAADIVLGRSGLAVLHRGIVEGRRASANMMKYLLMGTSSNFGNMFSMAAASVFLPFLPMLPTQILLNNFLYDVAQIAIPSDNVDRSALRRPQRWDIGLVRDFMLVVGPVSSLFDFLTFYVLLRVLHADAALFHTGWFVESLATQTLVLFVIRTLGDPLKSRPGLALTCSTLSIVAIAFVLPVTPLASVLGFTVPPASYFLFLAVAVVTYLLLVEFVKRRLVQRLRRQALAAV